MFRSPLVGVIVAPFPFVGSVVTPFPFGVVDHVEHFPAQKSATIPVR
jgi:hypothetical protein